MLAFPVGVLGKQFAEEVGRRTDENKTNQIVELHKDKTVEAKLRSLARELNQFQFQLMEFTDMRSSLSEHTHEILEQVTKGNYYSCTSKYKLLLYHNTL